MQMPVGFITNTLGVTALYIFKGELLKAFPIDQAQSVAMVLFKLSAHATYVLETLWGLWLIPFGLLVIRCGFIPLVIGYYLLLNAFACVLITFTFILFPQYQATVETYSFPLLLGELVVTLWFVIVGARFKKGTVIII